MKITIIGLGLIGGSMALTLKNNTSDDFEFIGCDTNIQHEKEALELNLVDRIATLDDAIEAADLIIISTPVNVSGELLQYVLEHIKNTQTVIDTGSTKGLICKSIRQNAMRKRYVATHPMWGTENSGPMAATNKAFSGKACVICEKEKSDPDAVALVIEIYKSLKMNIIYMNPEAHDVHVAYISHIAHISSFALANTVLEKEKEENTIFELASGGFESTVRLAKSSPEMWVPIFKQNRENLLDVLNEHISQLRKFKSCLEKENYTYLRELIENANSIRKILR